MPVVPDRSVVVREVKGPYQRRTDLGEQPAHSRPMKWLTERPRTDFDQDRAT
jgi:hypothetical protein